MLWSESKVTRKLRVLCLIFAIFSPYQSAEAYFEGCDYNYNINAGYSYLESHDYPQWYPPGSSCRYKFSAPPNHEILVNCTINLAKGANDCTSEYFYLARDGDKYLRDSERFCGDGTFIRRSAFNSVVLAYLSGGSEGRFQCQLYVRPQQCDCGWSVNTKIVHGEETFVNEYPSIVALRDRTKDGALYCGASIISYNYLLTAAHCANFQPNPSLIEARVGRHNLQLPSDTKYAAVYYISKIIKHPGYISDPIRNDIALMKTTRNIEFSKGVGPICIPPPSNAKNDFAYEPVDAVGWGATDFAAGPSPTLQKATLQVTEHQTCSKTYPDVLPSQICTYDSTGNSKDSCVFDSGGPVIFKNKRQFLLGIISSGKPCHISSGYAMAFNTRVTSYLQWIRNNTERSICTVEM